MDLTVRPAPRFLKSLRKNMTEAKELLLVLPQLWLKNLQITCIPLYSWRKELYKDFSSYVFRKNDCRLLKTQGVKPLQIELHSYYVPCWFSNSACTETMRERVPKSYELVFLRKPPFLELEDEGKHEVAWNSQSERPKLATLKTVCGFLIHMRRNPQLLLGTHVSNTQIQLFCNHPSLGAPSIHWQEFISLTQGSSSCLWAIIPENSKSCNPNKSTDYLFSRNNIEQIGGCMCMFYILI